MRIGSRLIETRVDATGGEVQNRAADALLTRLDAPLHVI